MKTTIKIFLLLFLSAGFGSILSCTQTGYRALYNNLNIVIEYKAYDFVTLSGEQKALFEQKLKTHHQWHRKTALPRLIPIIRLAQTSVKNGFTENTDKAVGIKFQAEIKYTVEHLSDDIAALAKSLTPDQIAQLKKSFKKYAESADSDSSDDPDKRIEHRTKNIISRLEMYYGDFSSEQKDKIEEIIRSGKMKDSARVPYLIKTQKGFIDLLESGVPAETVKKYITSWAIREDSFIPDEFRKTFEEQARDDRRLRLLIDRTIVTQDQRKEGIRKLDDLIGTIQVLSSE